VVFVWGEVVGGQVSGELGKRDEVCELR